MKKLLIAAALLGAGYYLFCRKDDKTTTTNGNTNRQVTMENLFTEFDGYVIRDNKGYNLMISDGKLTLLPESSVTNMAVLPVDLDIYEQFSETNPELIEDRSTTAREAQVYSEVPSCNRSVFE